MPEFFILIGTLIFLRCSLSLVKRTHKSRQTAIDHMAASDNRTESLSVVWSRGKSKWCVPFFLRHTNISSDLWASDGDEPSSATLFRYVVRDGVFPDQSLKGKNYESGLTAGLGSGAILLLHWSEREAELNSVCFERRIYPTWVWFYLKRLSPVSLIREYIC